MKIEVPRDPNKCFVIVDGRPLSDYSTVEKMAIFQLLLARFERADEYLEGQIYDVVSFHATYPEEWNDGILSIEL
jgi:hypothetical protein